MSVVGAVLLPIGLIAVTGWNLTRSSGLDEARSSYMRGDLVPCLERALDHLACRPWSREASLLAARCLSRLDYPDAAEPYYTSAGQLALEDLQVRAFGLVRGNHRQRAIKAYEEILARSPDNITALRRLAAVQLSENNIPQLEGLANRLIETPGGAAVGYTVRGVAAHNDHNHEGAVAAFEQVLKLDPDLRTMPLPRLLFWSHLSEGLIKLGRFNDVVRYLTKVLSDTPDARLMNTVGQAYVLSGAFAEGERCFRQAADWEPANYQPWLSLGKLEVQRRQLAAAQEHLEKADQLMPQQAEVLQALMSVYRLQDRPSEVARVERILKDRSPRLNSHDPMKGQWPSYAL